MSNPNNKGTQPDFPSLDNKFTLSRCLQEKVDFNRRKTLGLFGLAGVAGLTGCGGSSNNSSSSNASTASSVSSSSSISTSSGSSVSSVSSGYGGSCVLIPTETIGPFPLSTLLNSSSVLRENIAEDKTGIPLQVKLRLVNINNSCTPVSAYVYIWHCDKDGLYSGYSTNNNVGQAGQTYCRGVQYTNGDGEVTFTTIYPGWYAGRITHIHFQVFLTTYSSTA